MFGTGAETQIYAAFGESRSGKLRQKSRPYRYIGYFDDPAKGVWPGAPMVRNLTNDGKGPLVSGCPNVSSSDASFEFNRENYIRQL